MKRSLYVIAAGISVATLLLLALKDVGWTCKAKSTLSAIDEDITYTQEIQGVVIGSSSFGSSKGATISQSVGLSGTFAMHFRGNPVKEASNPLTLVADLRGKGNFKFRYSENISGIQLWSGSSMIYDGTPIGSHQMPPGPLRVELQRNGSAPDTLIEVTDSCSMNSFWSSLFRTTS
jgi:hypothetical protein